MYTEELGSKLRAAYEKGAAIRDLADEFTLSFSATRNYLLRAGATLRGRGGAHPPRGAAPQARSAPTPSHDDSPVGRILSSMQAHSEESRNSVEEKPVKYSSELGAQLKTAYERGLSIGEVADAFNLTSGTTRNYLLRAGTLMRGRGGAGHSLGGFRRAEPTTRLRRNLG